MRKMSKPELEKQRKIDQANAQRQKELHKVKNEREKRFRLNEEIKLNRE